MKAPHLYLSEWLRRLGVPNEAYGAPELATGIQPVHVVGDSSRLLNPLMPPTAFSGGYLEAQGVPVDAGFEFRCRAPGGAFVHDFYLHTSGVQQNSIGYGIFPTPQLVINGLATTCAINLERGPVRSELVVCSDRSPPDPTAGANFPKFHLGGITAAVASRTHRLPGFFVPPGAVFYGETAETTLSGIFVFVYIRWSEFPGPDPA